jgi:hypothetical protein
MGLERLEENPPCIPKLLFNFLKLTVAFVILIIISIILPLALLVSFSIRKAVYLLAYWNEPGIKMITCMGTLFAAEDLHNRPKANVVAVLTVEGDIQLERYKEIANCHILNATDSCGELIYPELKQCIVRWGGYYFWKDCLDFNLENHVKLYNNESGESFTHRDINRITETLVNAKWTKDKPLWEVTLVQNFYSSNSESGGPYTAVLARWHHATGDGYAWLNLIVNKLCQTPTFKNAMPTWPRRSLGYNLIYWTSFPLRGAWALSELVLFGLCYHFDWRVPADQKKTHFIHALNEPIQLESIKEIKNHFGVSFASTLHAVLAGAHRQMLIRKGFCMPKVLPCCIALPLPGHSLKLRNHM